VATKGTEKPANRGLPFLSHLPPEQRETSNPLNDAERLDQLDKLGVAGSSPARPISVTRALPAVLVGAALALGLSADIGHERPLLLRDNFDGRDRVITNHYAYHAPDAADAHRSRIWEVESGCALRSGNQLWTGVPTSNVPDRDCSNGTGSAVFRMWTKRTDFRDVAVSFGLRNNGYTSTGESWDGVKIYLRRQDGDNFYTAEVNRREGNVIIQRKCDGEYGLLSQVRTSASPARIGEWEDVAGTVVNLSDDAVRIQVVRSDGVALEAIDAQGSCDVLRRPGRIGIRGDRTDFHVDGVEVRGLAAG